MSFGAYHAANSLFKHPDVIKRCFAMSGVYDLRNFMDGMYDDNFYFNNPVDYLQELSDGVGVSPSGELRYSFGDGDGGVGAAGADVSIVGYFAREGDSALAG